MSQKPVLYATPRSPPCRAVILTAGALGLDLELVITNLKDGDHLQPKFLKMNPQHTIPVLDDNGTVVTDSHVICAYLADKYAVDETLYPKTPDERRLIDARMFYDAGHLFPRVRFMIEPVFYFGAVDIPADRVLYMQKAYDGLEYCLANGPYLSGDRVTIADLCCIASISTAAAFAPIDPEKFPKLVEWTERMAALPYYAKCNQEGLDMAVKLVTDTLAERKSKA